ncbi:MAG: N-6 DNA methylase [Planctomycetes bacterium]|uniref:Eco57I restriction-modification methylase domain-containing protein n=1 Tax=Candidatus Wunengus californicus TaxID=3367619 RepID=UPI004025D4B3|nr:N-6 DNA methylase [Planctomycetota bacterium]
MAETEKQQRQNIQIQTALKDFSNGSLLGNTKKLLNVLGYKSDRTFQLLPNNYKGFAGQFRIDQSNFDPEKAKTKDWQSVDIVFQITQEDIKKTYSIFDAKQVDNKIIESYLFFALSLKGDRYTRSDLVKITREINKLTPMPAIIVFRYGNCLTISIIDRRPNKKDPSRDVLTKKISLIKDINTEKPHRAHIAILSKFALPQLIEKHKTINTLDDLYRAFRSTLDISELNKDFYKQISAWYYYATSTIKLPIKPEYYKDDEDNIKNFTVRLICRMIFCWFLKEKGLINPKLLELYDYDDSPVILVKKTTKDFDTENSYYRGVLQNIFLSCLNSPMNVSKRKAEYLGKGYLPDDFDYGLLDKIPFLNGGLFDRLEEDNYNETIDDGPLYIPNELFYGKQLQIGTGRNARTAKGLNRILASFVFTIDESTPLEEEVALDPELLGLVFENLLAEIDPDEEVAKTARRESGSFYTLRKIIDNMVNASLLLYLTNYFREKGQKGVKKKLYQLIYQNKIDEHDNTFKKIVVDALDSVKVLDPACGSGAFPMGMLHKIVSILKIVDPKNHLWLDKQLSRIEDKFQRDNFAKILEQHLEDYPRKLGIIKNTIYGIDNQPLAVLITKLRFFISLLIEQQIDLNLPKENYHITPLPNIETKIICADSLVDTETGLFDESVFKHLRDAKEKYYRPNLTKDEKDAVASEISEILSTYFPSFAQQVTGKKMKDTKSENERNKAILKQWFQHANLCAPFFNLDLFFPELAHQAFDIVIGNPPYGGKDISEDVKTRLALGKKDPYGAFIARFLGNGRNTTPLKNGGILAYIVSDTFMTIKTHYQLRQQMMRNYIHKMIRVHPDTFKATVNTAIIICERNVYPERTPFDKMFIDSSHHCQMVDMTNISIHDDYDRFLEILHKTEEFEEEENISNSEYAIYHYPQELIKTNSNLPFFFASPKLFALMNDTTAPAEYAKLDGKTIQIRKINFNGKEIKLTKLGQIAEVRQGLATGDNDSYLFQNPAARGTYRSIEDNKDYLLTEDDIAKIAGNDKLRLEIIDKGISRDDPKSARYFEGRYILPYDKGGESDSDEGWMPNYYVPTNYFIDWSEWAAKRLKTYTIAQRIKDNNESKEIKGHYNSTTCAVIRNADTYFREGITFSRTGVYAPTFRLNTSTVYDTEGSTIFIAPSKPPQIYLGLLCSKLVKFLSKNFIGHTVHCQVDELKELQVLVDVPDEIKKPVQSIVKNQKRTLDYDYASNEQLEIDRLVYEAYGLNEDDIAEVENWYARRYPKLARTQNNRVTPKSEI